jgi:hypothetical protein
MTMFSKIAVAVALAAFTSPGFAQSFDPDLGTGNLVPLSHAPIAPRHDKATARLMDEAGFARRQNGFDAFAMSPATQPNLDPNSPALAGGGSLGYNQMLLLH